MDMQNYSEDDRKRNLGLCMSAGVETPSDEDPTRFQRRHFPNKMTSNIFFCDSSLEDASRKNGNDFYASAGLDTRYNDQKQSEKRHYHSSSDNGSIRNDDQDQDEEEVDSSETAEPKNDNAAEEMDNAANENEEEQVDSSGAAESVDEQNDEQQQSDGTTANDQGEREEAESSGTADSRETEDDYKKTQRRHFGNKMNSNIFFSGLPIENMSLRDPEDPTDFRKRKG